MTVKGHITRQKLKRLRDCASSVAIYKCDATNLLAQGYCEKKILTVCKIKTTQAKGIKVNIQGKEKIIKR